MSSAADQPSAAEPARRPGGRTARVRAQVLAAVRAELAERGYDGLTVESVATRAGVHRTTVHRRWHDIGGLLADVLDAAGEDDWRAPDTGSLLGDLTALNGEIQDALTVRPSLMEALVAASFRSGAAARAQRRLWEHRYARCADIVERATARGELTEHVDARALLVAATAPVYHELLLLRSDPDPGLPRRAAAAAEAAARGGVFDRSA
ncbi:TetR/AcrR family transcriptional regulator [Streptomyces sp. VRA16 Mangrove soil]|uniref:TetR/AcrR family transcriptional regulator n=1 Tax=Streptomyces sp. VRA16 Mangrove soil TaxID=2817434 RepID=UPI001A9E1BAE|nr:TetR/AcrR family transcriptional regulator [Streptomyces sp. VRA16 Mangrove soil]MBO1332200.1 TetR/AcrR family transcriptional regulator [Streptomyces sp. VRA16 Mangrove soil]